MDGFDLEKYTTFPVCLEKKAPVLTYSYVKGMRVITWENAGNVTDYQKCYPENLMNEVVPAEGRMRYILVSDSVNMLRKGAMLLAKKKVDAIKSAAIAYNRPLRAEIADYGIKTEAIEINIANENKEVYEKKCADLFSRFDEWNFIFFNGFSSDNLDELFFKPLLGENAFGSLVGVSCEMYEEEQVQRLVYEGGYKVLFLPVEEENYYYDLALGLFMEPAIRTAVVLHPCQQSEFEFDKMMADSPYLAAIRNGDLRIRSSIRRLKMLRGKDFQETDIAAFFELVLHQNYQAKELLREDKCRTQDDLNKMIGLESVKRLAKSRIALWNGAQRNPLLKQMGKNYIFVGNSGTGKTISASLLHEVLFASGCISGKFVVATRADIIGSYVGQTAPMVKKLFEKAEGGTLFVDEAGFFLQQGCGGFIHEAFKEFIRYMEIRRDVSVIFALYPGELAEFRKLDAGLTSRISQVIEFADYSTSQLCDISKNLWAEQGYRPSEGVEKLMAEFFKRQREKERDTFGNARTARKLTELTIEETELRLLEEEAEWVSCEEEAECKPVTVTEQDVEQAIQRIAKETSPRRPLGFWTEPMRTLPGELKTECLAV